MTMRNESTKRLGQKLLAFCSNWPSCCICFYRKELRSQLAGLGQSPIGFIGSIVLFNLSSTGWLHLPWPRHVSNFALSSGTESTRPSASLRSARHGRHSGFLIRKTKSLNIVVPKISLLVSFPINSTKKLCFFARQGLYCAAHGNKGSNAGGGQTGYVMTIYTSCHASPNARRRERYYIVRPSYL